jgi:hypothetical protein
MVRALDALRQLIVAGLTGVVLVAVLAVVIQVRGAALAAPPAAVGALDLAAAKLEASLGSGGTGISFRVVQRNTVFARPDGPKISVVEDADPHKVVATVDEYAVNSMVSVGGVSPAGFWMEIRQGPEPGATPDFEKSPLFWRVSERDGSLWRDDGAGWYPVDVSPGMGMDPITARLLPALVRGLSDLRDLGQVELDGRSLHAFKGRATPELYPGVVASDGKDFTSETFEISVWLDEDDRLVRLQAAPKNLNQKVFDLIADTVVELSYDQPLPPPAPQPTMTPESVDGAASQETLP